MPTLLLVRHAQASFGGENYDVVSDAGRRQADALVADLDRRGAHPDRIITGSLERQRHTAEPIAETFARSIEVDPRWNEYESDEIVARHVAPAVAPTTSREFQAVLDQALLAWVTDASDGAEWPAFRARVAAALDEAASSLESGQTALICSSGGPIAAACTTLLGLPPEAFVALNRVMVNGGVTKVVTGRSGMTLVSFNEHAYLERRGDSLVTYR